MTEITPIPSRGFIRGAVVRRHGTGPNMLVVRGMGERTVVVVIEADDGGNLRLREPLTADLVQMLDAAPIPTSVPPTPPGSAA